MLMPKRVKHRKVMRGRMRGRATRGNTLAYGDFGLVATEPCWMTANQIEAYDHSGRCLRFSSGCIRFQL